jgi:hypothetical protein
MAAISWSTRISAYLITLGYPSAVALLMADIVNKLTTVYSSIEEDAGLIELLEKFDRTIQEVAVAYYDYNAGVIELTWTDIQTWMQTYRTDIDDAALVVALSHIIADDINVIILNVPSSGMMTDTQVYAELVDSLMGDLIRHMRYFATNAVHDDYNRLVTPGLPA